MKKKASGIETIGNHIKALRQMQKISANAFAKKVGIDAQALNAIESGRTKNPSLERIQTIAKALGLTRAELFLSYDNPKPAGFQKANPPGEFVMSFGKRGFKVISYTPPLSEMFCGKLILYSKSMMDETGFLLPVMIFIQVIIGKVNVTWMGNEHLLREGRIAYFDGRYSFKISNTTHRDASLLFFTSPAPWGQSFLKGNFSKIKEPLTTTHDALKQA